MIKPDEGQNSPPGDVNRRTFIGAGVSALAGPELWHYRSPQAAAAGAPPVGQPKMVPILEFSDVGVWQGVVFVPRIIKSDEEWRKQLSRSAVEITREADTEMTFTGAYWNLREKGLFRGMCCDTALLSSQSRFDSGTGWPSFLGAHRQREYQGTRRR